MDTGTVIVRDPLKVRATNVALYARVSSVDQKNDLERQLERLKDYAAAQGYQVTRMVSEMGSGLNDRRPKFLKLLTDPTIGVIVVEYRDRGTRFGFTYIEQLLAMQGRRLEVIFLMMEFNKAQALARSIELWEKRHTEFDQLPDITCRVARGDYEFFSSVDIELGELEQEAQRNGFVLDSNCDGQHLVYTIEPMSRADHAAFLAEEEEE